MLGKEELKRYPLFFLFWDRLNSLNSLSKSRSLTLTCQAGGGSETFQRERERRVRKVSGDNVLRDHKFIPE